MLCRSRANGPHVGIWYIYGFDACYDSGSTFRLKWFLNGCASNRKIVGNRSRFCLMAVMYLLIVYGIVYTVEVEGFSNFFRKSHMCPILLDLGKKAVVLYRSTRRLHYN